MVSEHPGLLGGEKVESRARIMVMITDGVPYYRKREKSEVQAIQDTITQAQLNKEDGITGIVGMVRNSDGEIIPEDKHYIFDAIASDPLDKHNVAIDDLAEGVKVVFKNLAHHTCPSMVSYNEGVVYHFKLDESYNYNIDELIDEIPETNERYTEIHKALKLARQGILAYSPRVSATKVTMVATDGETWITENRAESPPDRRNPTIGGGYYYTRARYNLVITGVPNDNDKNGYKEWIKTATDPDFDPNDPTFSPDDNIFNLKDGSSFDDLNAIAPYIAEQICSLAPDL